MDGNIIFSQIFEDLKNEVEQIRVSVSMLMFERDRLVLTEGKNIEMKYMLVLGSLETRAFETQCGMLRLKRKSELMRAYLNRGQAIDMTAIETVLEKEFFDYQQEMEERLSRFNEALDRSHARSLSDREAKELKKLYRKIIKALHPDLHPDLTFEQSRLFQSAVQAYENGDLEAMRVIYELVATGDFPDDTPDIMSLLTEEKERLLLVEAELNREINRIQNEYPFTLVEILEDTQRVEALKSELLRTIHAYAEAARGYQRSIEEMLRTQ